MFPSISPERIPRLSENALKVSLRVASVVVFALGWELLAHRLDSLLLPTFTETLAALAGLVTTAQLWEALWLSNQAMVLGFLLAAAVGISLGLLVEMKRDRCDHGWSR